ncbi:ubiquinol-cytochrome C reductase hinge protein-domain-containing protein [Bisporella sp. PMI_857]|nr:ubiquinol-cytochrome C reductase hinge protein-domain-containing protein [Bisporella sp. PMI_857]
MGFFDSLSDLVSAATPWSQVEAEAVQGGTSTTETPAQKDVGGEGESIDDSKPTPDKKGKDDDAEEEDSKDDGEDKEDENEEEEEEEAELEDPKEKFEEECKESKECHPAKHHFDECVERVTGASDSDDKAPHEDCVEEFFHLAHCATACAAPKLWSALK